MLNISVVRYEAAKPIYEHIECERLLWADKYIIFEGNQGSKLIPVAPIISISITGEDS
jgi:hypothetical protein